MMKKFVSIFLSFILLVSHVNLTLGTHFCGGEAVMSRLMIVNENLSCGMANMGKPCEDAGNQKLSFTNPPCCENHYQTLQSPDDFIKEAHQVNGNIHLVVALVYSIVHVGLFPKSTHQFFADYSPPPLEKDMQVLLQTFLI